jgi:hypothetical protein
LGADATPGSSERNLLKLDELTANSDLFNPAHLPSKLAIYIWYVPPVKSIEDGSLEPEYVQAMKTLGYMQ